MAVFVAMATLVKASGQLPAGQIVFFRSFFATLPVLAFLAWRRELRTGFRTARPLGHIVRSMLGVTGMGLGFFALTRLPLPEAITLNYAQPILVVLFGGLFLGEAVRIYRWSAVTVGMAGVIIVSWPKLSLLRSPEMVGDAELLGVMAALAGAAVGAVTMLLVRSLVQTERTATIVLWFSLSASAFGLLTLPFGWVGLSAAQFALLVGGGPVRRHRPDPSDRGLPLRGRVECGALRVHVPHSRPRHRLSRCSTKFRPSRCSPAARSSSPPASSSSGGSSGLG